MGLTESFLGSVDDVEEAVLVLLPQVEVGQGRGHGGQRRLVDEQEEGLVRMKLEAPPDYVDELSNGDVIGDEELGLVQDGELLLSVIALDDDGNLGRVLVPDGFHILHSEVECPALLERLSRLHFCNSGVNLQLSSCYSDKKEAEITFP